ncbi:retrovirus-related pol polyprotein from transposon TNT 1-94 [Tanacetum coccineum]
MSLLVIFEFQTFLGDLYVGQAIYTLVRRVILQANYTLGQASYTLVRRVIRWSGELYVGQAIYTLGHAIYTLVRRVIRWSSELYVGQAIYTLGQAIYMLVRRFIRTGDLYAQNPPYKFKWTEKTVPVTEGSSETTPEGLMLVKCSEMWIAIERLKQGESINVQDLKTNLYWEFRKFTSRDGESLESYYSRFYKMMNELVKNQNDCYNHQVNVQFLLQLQPEWQRFVTLVKQSQELKSVSYHKLYDILKQHQYEVNEIRAERITHTANPLALEYGHVAKECQKPKRAKDAAYHKEKMLLYKQEEAGFQFNADQADWRDDTDDEPDDQELEAHYMYMAQLQEVTPDVADNFRPIFNSEPLQEVQNDDDHYNVIANNGEHPVQPKSVNDTYLEEQGDTNITIDSLDMSTNGETVDQDDDDLANERDLLATLIDKLNVKLMTTKTKEREQYFEIQELKAQLQDRNIAVCELKKLYEKLKGKFVETKFEKSSVIRQPNAFKSQRQLILGKLATFSDSLAKKDFSKKDLSKPVTAQILPQNVKSILKNTNVIAPGIWWYPKFTPSEYKWKPKSPIGNVNKNVSMPIGNASRTANILEPMTPRCSKHMTGNLKLLSNFVEKFLGTVKFGNDQIAPILGYRDLGNDLLTGSRGSDLYSITLQDTSTPNPICLMAKATSSQAWLWHRRLSHLNFDTINLLSKNDIVIGLPKLKFIKHHLCSSCEYTWTHLLRSKDETPKVLINFLTFVQRGLHAQVRTVRTDKGYSTQSRAYRMLSSDPVPQCPTTELEHDSLTPIPQSQENVPHAAETVTMSNELDFLFSLMFDELLYRTAIVVSKSSAVNAADAPNKCQQQNTTQSTTITVAADIPPLNIQHHQKLQSSTHQH